MVTTGLKSDAQRKAYQQHQSPTPKKLAIAQSLSGSFGCIFNTFSAIWKSCPCFITLHCKNVQVHATFLVLVFFISIPWLCRNSKIYNLYIHNVLRHNFLAYELRHTFFACLLFLSFHLCKVCLCKKIEKPY